MNLRTVDVRLEALGTVSFAIPAGLRYELAP